MASRAKRVIYGARGFTKSRTHQDDTSNLFTVSTNTHKNAQDRCIFACAIRKSFIDLFPMRVYINAVKNVLFLGSYINLVQVNMGCR